MTTKKLKSLTDPDATSVRQNPRRERVRCNPSPSEQQSAPTTGTLTPGWIA